MTKREHMPIGYDPRLDRRQPPPLGCMKILALIVVGLAALVPLGWGIASALPKAEVPLPTLARLPPPTVTATDASTPTPSATFTPDAWGLTGTALANATVSPTPTPSATLDYCWWLTPTSTPTPTAAFTPDNWGATGTAMYMATHPYVPPTPEPPRELCRDFPTWTPEGMATATLTPFPFPQLNRLRGLEATSEVMSGFVTFTPSAAPTHAPVVPAVQVREAYVESTVFVTSPPQVIRVTAPPVVIREEPEIIVVTATPRPVTATVTLSPTVTTDMPTSTTTATETPTETPTAALEPPTDVPTDVPTATGAPTEIPPTDEPPAETQPEATEGSGT